MATDSLQPSVDPEDEVQVADALPPVVAETLSLPRIDVRERALPIRPGDLTRLLMAQPELTDDERDKMGKLGPLLGSIFHSDFFLRLRELKELYSPLDPDSDYIRLPKHSRVRTERSDEEFLAPFEATLDRANYRRLDIAVIEQAVQAPNEMGLTYVPDFKQFEHLRIYARGYTQISRVFRSAKTKFRKRTMLLDAYQRLVIALKFRDGLDLGPYIRSDVVYIRMFKDVPHVDMEMHLPEQGTRVKMRWIDKAQIASPVVMGLPTLAMKLFSFSVFAALANPMVLAPLMAVPVTAGMNSFFGFHRAKHKHLSSMIRNLYYLTMANNASVLNRLVDSAEEEEYKEAMLAYYFLWRRLGQEEEWTMEQLDSHIENFLKTVSNIEINFEIADALGKLFRLGLVRRDEQGRLHAVTIDQALVALDKHWDNTFCYS
jgi:Protein of unknown function (DUF3754)